MKQPQPPSQPTQPFKCPKCSHQEAEEGVLYMSGGFWSKFFDIQGKKFKSMVCTQCGFTELYSVKTGKAGNVFDFLSG